MCAGIVAEITVLLQNERATLNVAMNPHLIIVTWGNVLKQYPSHRTSLHRFCRHPESHGY